MLNEIRTFPTNALALELIAPFTESDAKSIMQLFEAKLNQGHQHVNLLVKVQDLSVMKHMEWKAFFKGELWGFKHFGKIGRCAVVAHSDFIRSVVKIENRILGFNHPDFEERYFDTAEIEDALLFIVGR